MWISYTEDQIFKDIGRERQLFFDDDLIGRCFMVRRNFHHPRKHPANPMIVNDQPWEKFPYFRGNSFNVVRDDQAGVYHCWYEDIRNFHGLTRQANSFDLQEHLLYARSDDGIHWQKPTFEKYIEDGQPTNTVFGYPPHGPIRMSDPAILIDPLETDERKRFKMVYWNRGGNLTNGYGTGGLCTASSPDGIDWTPHPENPIYNGWGGDMQQVNFDPYSKSFVCYGRVTGQSSRFYPQTKAFSAPVSPARPEGYWNPGRRVYRTESEDLVHWSEPELLFTPDQRDNLDDEYYGFVVWRPTADWHVGILDKFHVTPNTLDNYLLYCRDGRSWDVRQSRHPFIERGPDGSYDALDAETGLPPIEVGDELWFYYGGGKVHHDWWVQGPQEGLDVPEARDTTLAANGYGLCLATMRKDGYVSLDASVREGFIETKPIWSSEETLYINANCEPDGYVLVEVLSSWNEVYKGKSREDAIPVTGDAVAHPVRWKDAPTLKAGGPHHYFKLRFYLRNAALYGFHCGPAPA